MNTTVLHDTNGIIYDKYEIGLGYVFKHSMCCIKNCLYFSQFTPLKLCSKHKSYFVNKHSPEISYENGNV